MAEAIDNLARLIERGGVVMIPLLVVSIISITLILERMWFWVSNNRPAKIRRFERMSTLLADNDPRCESLITSDGSVYGSIASQLSRGKPSNAAAISAVESQRPRLERFMVTLSTIITAAPLLGILGTVLGIIQSFDLLGQQEVLTDPRTVSAGIAEALLTTALGLVVALVTLFPYMIYRGQVDRTLGRLEALVAAAQEGAVKREKIEIETSKATNQTINNASSEMQRQKPVSGVSEGLSGGV